MSSKAPIILSLDIASRTGYAVNNRLGKVEFGATVIPKTAKSSFQKFKHFYKFMIEAIDTYNPEYVVVEQPFFRGLDGSALLLGLYTIAKTEATCRKIKFDKVSISTIKKSLTGNGKASKLDMIEGVKDLGYTVKVDDEADAIALNLYYQKHLKRRRKK